jgi:hypothetical protein
LRILFMKRLVKNYQWINLQRRSNVIRPVLKRLWWTGLRSWKVVVGIQRSMMTQKAKSWPGLRQKQKNPGRWHAQTFGTLARPNIPVRFPEDGLILFSSVPGTVWQKRKVHLRKIRDSKCHVLSWMIRYAASENPSREWKQH